MTIDSSGHNLPANYDPVAEKYASQFFAELDKKPFDRKVLEWLAERVGNAGAICDLGCGPGQIARYLRIEASTPLHKQPFATKAGMMIQSKPLSKKNSTPASPNLLSQEINGP